MKLKILDFALLTIFSGASSIAWSQKATTPSDAATPTTAPAPAPQCTDTGCQSSEGTLFRLQTQGAHNPVTRGTTANSGSQALQPDRRVTIEEQTPRNVMADVPQPGAAKVSGKFSLQLPNGGVVWATEDSTLGQAELSVSGPSLVTFENGRIQTPLDFYVRSNYPGFIQKLDLLIYRASDIDLTEPLATVPMPVTAVGRASWDGTLKSRFPLRAGDNLIYVLRATGAEGAIDETSPRTLQLVRAEEAARGETLLRESAERALGRSLTVQQAETQNLLNGVFSGNGLRQQNIAIHGSRVRIQGRNLPPDAMLQINGESYPVDLEQKFVAEFLEPIGKHTYNLTLSNGGEKPVLSQPLVVDVTGNYFFGVALADLTVYQNKATGPGQELALNGRTDSVLSDGRLAFYGKAKIDGKYLITAQADTQERDVRRLFSGFGKADATDVFRTLDPNQYYPVYGDDSTTYRDIDTQGRFYLRVDWDKSQALWGNYSTGFTGTEFAQYQRSLYGAALNYRSMNTNPWGESKTFVRAFASQAQSAPGHSEFVGTGGSLYYLHNTNLLPGSDVVTLEITDTTTGNVQNRVTLVRGTDYTINELQGRILLNKPLAQITSDNVTRITTQSPLSGYGQRLIVDYEFVPVDNFVAGNLTAGVRAKQWVNDNVAVGGTYVDEKQAGSNYTLKGVDLTLQAGRGTFLKLEHSQTESTGTPVFLSTNGGFTFAQTNANVGYTSGAATALSGQANFKELGWTQRDWTLGAWYRRVDAGYSIARSDIGMARTEYGANVRGQVSDTVSIYALQSRVERGGEALDQTQVTAEWRPTDDDTLSAEVRRLTQQQLGGDVNGTLGAVKYTRRVTPNLDVYGVAQKTLDNDGGRYADNDAVTLGAKYRFANLSTVGIEGTHGDRGNAATASAEYRLSPEHTVYGRFTQTSDDSAYDSIFNPRAQGGWTLGQRWRLSDKANVFNESQYLKDPTTGNGLVNTFGLDFYPAVGWSAGFTLQQGDLEGFDGLVHRRAVSVSAGHTTPSTTWSSKAEWRQDSGAEQRTQWVLTNRIDHKIDESWRVSGKFNYSDTQDKLNAAAGAKYIEGGVGFAWRPYNDARYALLGRYTYLYDLATLGQVGGAQYDQKSNILSLEGVYKFDHNWEFAAKVARREGEARFGRGFGEWFNSGTTYAGIQARYELPQQWHALAEYRMLDVKDGGKRQGWMVGIDRDIGKNLRLGVGYNFTDFSDDLTKFGYKYKGFFINIVGSY
ncbi:hypothetical protein WKW79_12200 [Variovorax robiniae]|uniref:TonB-dependent receptor n=1 Tax=Variovorax robiniae TaxID=1836199 RepID=A0ABU8X8I1_9BURK